MIQIVDSICMKLNLPKDVINYNSYNLILFPLVMNFYKSFLGSRTTTFVNLWSVLLFNIVYMPCAHIPHYDHLKWEIISYNS